MEKVKISCETCYHYLGGVYACCRLNLEAECAAGEHEAWRPKRKEKTEEADDRDHVGRA